MGQRHYRNYGREKRMQKEGADYNEPRKSCAASKTGVISAHRMVKELQVSIHAAHRFAERVLEVDTHEMSRAKVWKIAEMLRSYLPENLINESRMCLFDDFYAVINGNIVVTVVKKK